MSILAETFRAMGDETRLRILRLLLEDPLNVGELTRILGIAQPTVSKHLGELRKAGLVENTRRSGFSYYRISNSLGDVWEALSPHLSRLSTGKGDLARLQEILNERHEYAQADRFVVPGRSWVAWSRALCSLLPPLRVADFGCGDGAFTEEIAYWAEEVIAVDANPAFLKLAEAAGERHRNIRFLNEKMERVSIGSASVDLVVISQSLHYAERPLTVLAEASRILVDSGQVLIIELLPHQETWVKEELHHRWLGFEPAQLQTWLNKAGFEKIHSDIHLKRSAQKFQPFVISASKRNGKAA